MRRRHARRIAHRNQTHPRITIMHTSSRQVRHRSLLHSLHGTTQHLAATQLRSSLLSQRGHLAVVQTRIIRVRHKLLRPLHGLFLDLWHGAPHLANDHCLTSRRSARTRDTVPCASHDHESFCSTVSASTPWPGTRNLTALFRSRGSQAWEMRYVEVTDDNSSNRRAASWPSTASDTASWSSSTRAISYPRDGIENGSSGFSLRATP